METSDIIVGGKVSRYKIIVECYNLEVTLGRFDVHFAVSTMRRYSSAPRKGQLGTMLIIFF